MTKANHYSAAGKKLKAISLPESLFDGTINEPVMHRAVVAYQANSRQGTNAVKSRSEVSGGTRKPWRQKGTGRARAGTTRAPQWRGGGVAFGPTPRSYRIDLPRKVRRLARQSALNTRAREDAIHVVKAIALDEPKTKAVVGLLESIGVAGDRVVILTAGTNRAVTLSARNIPLVEVRPFDEATAYDILLARHVVIEEAALKGASATATAESDDNEA